VCNKNPNIGHVGPPKAQRQLRRIVSFSPGDLITAVKRLKGNAGCRLRIGDWRVIFIGDARSITVVAVGNRKEIYD
jgi:mRNA interferase RelE/StbE